MSRADAATVLAPSPRLSASIRASVVDFYYHSWRLVPANLVWGLLFVGAAVVGLAWLAAGLLVSIILALPTAGVYRLAALIVRGREVVLSDAFGAYRAFARPALALGLAGIAGTVVFGINIVTGLAAIGGPLGWAIATAAAWGLAALWAWLLVVWPLVLDPRRDGTGLLVNARLAALMVLAFPLRIGALLVVTAVIVAVSTVFFAALVTISVAFVALLSCHYVLPAADRLEARIGGSPPDR